MWFYFNTPDSAIVGVCHSVISHLAPLVYVPIVTFWLFRPLNLIFLVCNSSISIIVFTYTSISKMGLLPITSDRVQAFLPLNTWTEVVLLSTTPNNNDVYIATTEDKMKKRLKDMDNISVNSEFFERVKDFKVLDVVAVEVDHKWYRGKLINFNEFKSDNTMVELIDVGTFYQTNLQNLFVLPYFLLYEPLALPIKFKNFIPTTTKLSVKPLFTESELSEGFVLVDVKCNNSIKEVGNNGQHEKANVKCSNSIIELKSNQIEEVSVKHNGQHEKVNVELDNKNEKKKLSTKEDINTSTSFSKDNYYGEKNLYNTPLQNGDHCIITYFEDLTSIYVCKAVKNAVKNTYAISNYNIVLDTAENTTEIIKNDPVVGNIVKVYSSIFCGLYRAKILKNNYDGSYNVFYIDFGNIETVQSDVIFELADELKKQPGLVVKIGLGDYDKHIQEIPEKIKNMFQNFIEIEKPFVIEFDEISKNCLENVKLKDLENGSYINNYILDNLPVKSLEFKDIIQTNKSTTLINDDINEVKNLKNNDVVYLKHFEDMSNIYIVKNVQLFNEVMLKLNSIIGAISKTDYNKGDIVGVITESCIYRAKINSIDDNLINVTNIDFGNYNLIQPDSIIVLPDNLKKIPGLAIKVGINKPIITKTRALLNFINNTEKTPLYLEFDEGNSNGYQEMTLRRQDNLENIFNEFLKIKKHESTSSGEMLNNSCENNESTLKKKTIECSANDFQNIILKNGDYCIVAYFKDLKNIYLSKAVKDCTNNEYEGHNVHIILKTIQNQDRKPKTNLVIEDIVKVFSHSFQGFYRAKIINIVDNTDFHVSYLDFGNTEIIQSSDIFELSDELKIETRTPIRVSIKIPSNTKETDEIEKIFTKLIDNNVVLSIEYDVKSTNGLENVILKELKSGNSVNEEVFKSLSIVKMPIKNFDSCILTHFENFNCIYVSKPFDNENAELLESIFDSTDRITKTNLVLGDIVKVNSPSFQGFYRAKILQIVDNVNFAVFYIDFGNTEVVQLSDIFELSDNLKSQSGIAIKVGINVPCNAKINEEITKMFVNLSEKAETLSIEFDEFSETGLQNCILKEKSSGNNINDEVSKLLSRHSSVVLDKIENIDQTVEHIIKSSDIIINEIKSVSLKNGELVNLRYFHNSSSVFVGRGSEEHNTQYLDVLDKTAKDKSNKKKLNINIGDIVKTMYENIMCRAKILNKIDQSLYHISFIDFGNEADVHVDELYELSDELKKIPDSCIEIGFKGSPKIEKSETVNNYFDNLLFVPLYIEFDENNPHGLRDAILRRKDNNYDICDELFKIIEKPLVIKEESIQNPITKNEKVLINSSELDKIPSNTALKSGDVVFCSHFEDFNHIYLCKSSKNAIPENYCLVTDSAKENDIIKKNPKCGEIVRVKFDDKIVRAELISKSGETYNAFLIDIGKHVNVFSDEIFEISNDLKNVPSLVKMVGLKGTIDFNITEDIKNYFYCLWYNKPPVPLILIYDEGNLNYMNEVSLKKQSNGLDVIEDLLKICNTFNDVPDKLKPALQNPKMNGSTNGHCQLVMSGDHVEFLIGHNVDNIFVRLITQYEEFKPILDQLKKDKSENLQPISNPKISDMVIVYSSKYEGFYRARLFGIDEPTKFKCCLIDIGYIDVVHSKNMFVLPFGLSLTKIPSMVFRVSLAGLTKMVNNKIKSFLGSLEGKTFILEFDKKIGEPWFRQVVLKYVNNNLSINEEIQMLSAMNIPISQQRRLERKIIIPEKKIVGLKNQFYPIKSGSLVYITHFESLNSIYIRDASFELIENFSSFNRQMLKYYRNAGSNNCIKEQLNIGDKVCVRSLLNNVMYSRAIILGKNGNEYHVFYVDYGNKEIVDSEEIFELPKELEKYQHFVVKVQLQNMPPTTEKENYIIKEYFRKKIIVPNSTLIINFNELKPNGLDDVILKTEFYNESIIDEIINLVQEAPLLNITAGNFTN